MKWLISIFLILFSYHVNASLSCNVTKLFSDPEIANNPKFWEAIGKLGHNPAEEDVKKILRELHPNKLAATSSVPQKSMTTTAPSRQVSESHTAAKRLQKIPQELRKKYDQFLEYYKLLGEVGLRDKKSYHYEKLPQYGQEAHSVRLNDGYRVLFNVKPDGRLEIVDVGQHVYPH